LAKERRGEQSWAKIVKCYLPKKKRATADKHRRSRTRPNKSAAVCQKKQQL
jgi:hypothetical protein